jgi:hypothetical protein
MNKKLLALALCAAPLMMNAQAAFDALKLSQSELRGTSRSMSMAGAYTAVGGDLSSINQNPGGIGVYRNSDVGLTMSLDFNSSKSDDGTKYNKTHFMLNNVAYVGVLRTNNDILKNFNWGISFNRNNSFNRRYYGNMTRFNSSMSNYIAGLTNSGNWTKKDIVFTDKYNPYWDGGAPWMSVLAYDSYIINANDAGDAFFGLMDNGTTGFGEYEVEEKGHTDEYSLTLGGNVSDMLYWGLGFGLTDMKYDSYVYYGEGLNNAFVAQATDDATITTGNATYGLTNYLETRGTGYNFKMGFILKPVKEFRIGAAFHTPTFYKLTDTYATVASTRIEPNGKTAFETNQRAGDDWNKYDYRITTPWKFNLGLAGVIGTSGIISVDYEYTGFRTMRVKDYRGNEFYDTTRDIENYFKAAHKVSVGGEVKINNHVSLRAGYSYQTSPVNKDIEDNVQEVTTVSTNPSYFYDKTTQHITAGLGYRYKAFYADLAYVHQYRKGNFHSFSPVQYADGFEPGNVAEIDTHNNRVSLTLGVRF